MKLVNVQFVIVHVLIVTYQVVHVLVVLMGTCYMIVIVIRQYHVQMDTLYLLITHVHCVNFHVQLACHNRQIVQVV